jgi:hypothetical protein
MRPGLRALAPGEERYTVPGGGAIAVPVHAGDRVRMVDVEGLQRCELVAADDAGVVDPAILGAQGDGDARGPKQILSGASESARAVRSGLERRSIDLARARAVNLFGGESRPGDAVEFTLSRGGLLIVAAPGERWRPARKTLRRRSVSNGGRRGSRPRRLRACRPRPDRRDHQRHRSPVLKETIALARIDVAHAEIGPEKTRVRA